MKSYLPLYFRELCDFRENCENKMHAKKTKSKDYKGINANMRKQDVQKVKKLAICENMMPTKISCPTVDFSITH